jgi:glucose/arabinose dehydrogenase
MRAEDSLMSRRFLARPGGGGGLAVVGAVLIWPAVAPGQIADPLPPVPKGDIAIGLQNVAAGLTAPNFLTHAGDGTDRLFVVDQSGQIRLIKNGSLQTTPFLDLSSRLVSLGVSGTHNESDFDERGLLGLAFHPDFANPASSGFGKIYTYSSEPVNGPADFTTSSPPPGGSSFDCQNVVAEWTLDPGNPDLIDLASRRELFRIDKPQFNHNAGMLNFGPDGYLYVSTGDGGGADDSDGEPFIGGNTFGHGPNGNGQNIDVALGKILRVDVNGNNSANGNYGIPADNPFVGTAGLDEIYAYGFRNPFRFNFTSSGQLIAADVGQNDIEEIDIVTKGGNYGWRLKEGTFRFDSNGSGSGFVTNDLTGLPPGLIDPVAQYDHDDGLSAIGGFVYEGSAIPELAGKYVFGDFSTTFASPLGRLFYADLTTGEIKEFELLGGDPPLGLFVKGFGQDAAGELYLLAGTNLGPFGDDGVVLKIVPEPASAVLAGMMLGGLAMRRRRRRGQGTDEKNLQSRE